MQVDTDWLSRLLSIMPVTGRLDVRCHYSAPWKIAYEESKAGIMPYHVILAGTAFTKEPNGAPPTVLGAGDIIIFPKGDAHTLHDGSGATAGPVTYRPGMNHLISENDGLGEQLDVLCGHFAVARPHDRIMRDYLPSPLIVRCSKTREPGHALQVGEQLSSLINLMRSEADLASLGGAAMLNSFSAALFTLSLRLSSAAGGGATGLLSVAGNPRLAPALSAMLATPGYHWTLPELADRCNVSRATFTRHFQEKLGKSASDFLLDVRMSLAANELLKPGVSTGSVADVVGYQSEAAFQRIFKQKMGVTPAQWRRSSAGAG